MKREHDFKTKRNISFHCEIQPNSKKCKRCEINIFSKEQKFVYHKVLAECTYRVESNRFTKQKKSFLRERKVLNDEITHTEPRIVTPLNMQGHDGLCRMCQYVKHGLSEKEIMVRLNKELQENYGIIPKSDKPFFDEFIEEEIDIVLDEEII